MNISLLLGGLGLVVLLFGFLVFITAIFRRRGSEAKSGFFLLVLGLPMLGMAFYLHPKPGTAPAKEPAKTSSDPFAGMLNRAHAAVAKVQESRSEILPQPSAPVAAAGANAPSVAPTPILTVQQRLAGNRQKFKDLEKDYAALNAKRTNLPKNDLKAIQAFNKEAETYTTRLREVRAEQDDLNGLQ